MVVNRRWRTDLHFPSESRSNQSQMPSFCLEETDTGLTRCPLPKRQDAIQQQSVTQQVKTSDRKEDSKSQRKKHQPSKEQQVKRNDQGRGKQQMSPNMQKTRGNHSAITTNGPQERVQFTGKTDDGNTLSSKEKVRTLQQRKYRLHDLISILTC